MTSTQAVELSNAITAICHQLGASYRVCNGSSEQSAGMMKGILKALMKQSAC